VFSTGVLQQYQPTLFGARLVRTVMESWLLLFFFFRLSRGRDATCVFFRCLADVALPLLFVVWCCRYAEQLRMWFNALGRVCGSTHRVCVDGRWHMA